MVKVRKYDFRVTFHLRELLSFIFLSLACSLCVLLLACLRVRLRKKARSMLSLMRAKTARSLTAQPKALEAPYRCLQMVLQALWEYGCLCHQRQRSVGWQPKSLPRNENLGRNSLKMMVPSRLPK